MSVSVDTKGIFEKVFDNFKKITPALIVITTSTALILFLPTSILAKMSLDSLPDIWKRIIGIVFIVSTSLIIVIIIVNFFNKIKPTLFRRMMRKKYINLASKYKLILKKMLNNNNRCLDLDPNSGDTLYLVNGVFIYRIQNLKLFDLSEKLKLTYAPEPWLIDLYEKEPELFKI